MKTVYYACAQKLGVPDNITDEEIDDLVFENITAQVEEPIDYMWSERPDLFDFG